MASSNTLPTIKMTNPINGIKGMVSKKKKRYKVDGFDLDLTYICDNIIAMGYPAKNLEGVYRNHVDDVLRLLEAKHNNNYKIYNLCEEKKYQYDMTTFQQCAVYPFPDHNPPKIELIDSFCKDMHEWLSQDPKNVAAVHCKAGKGRTGTMICCYLLHSRQHATAAEALNFYAQSRTTDKKGVTIPSQRRYVEYYSQLLKLNRPYEKVAMNICEIRLHNLPKTVGTLAYSITVHNSKIHTEQLTDLKRVDSVISIKLDRCLVMMGDVKIEFSSTQILKHKQKLFHYWFNTFFINEITRVDSDGNVIFELNKPEIDDAHKDKQKMFSENFKVETIFQRIPQGSISTKQNNTNGIRQMPSYNRRCINNNDVSLAAYNNSNSVSFESQNNSNNHNHVNSTTNAYRNSCPSQRINHSQISSTANDFRHSRGGDNYPTTSEGSSSPESSSESSAEEWESGASPSLHLYDKLQNELKSRLITKRRRKRLKRHNSRIAGQNFSKDLRCNSRKYSTTTTTTAVEVNENCNQSSSTAKSTPLENLNCLQASANSDRKVVVINDSSDDYEKENDDDKVETTSFSSSANHLRSNLYPPLATLKNRIATMFQRFSMATASKDHRNPTSLRRNNTFELFSNILGHRTSRNVNFVNVRNELDLTLKRFRGCDEEKK